MKCWICDKDPMEKPKAECVLVHWKCLERIQIALDHLETLEKEER